MHKDIDSDTARWKGFANPRFTQEGATIKELQAARTVRPVTHAEETMEYDEYGDMLPHWQKLSD